jgi:hypothetical protein
VSRDLLTVDPDQRGSYPTIGEALHAARRGLLSGPGIGRCVGHTAQLTWDAFERARGGVLFIDEAYSLTNSAGTLASHARVKQEMI